MLEYARLTRALEYYKNLGYTYVDVPWWVSKEAFYMTLPEDVNPDGFKVQGDNYLVGSAEQSFIQMMIDGNLPKDNYVALTPCFRQEDVDELHQLRFMKVELFSNLVDKNTKKTIIRDSSNFFKTERANIVIENTIININGESMYDAMLNGIEVGSYGNRKTKIGEWVYGTGLAEPRFSIALNKG